MSAWYECKIAYQKTLENGKTVKVNEIYLVDSVSFTEAETRIYQEFGATIGEFTLVSVKKPRITELVHNEEAFKWYRVKVIVTTLDDKSGKESKSSQLILTSAETAKLAYDSVDNLFSDSTSDFEIAEILLTQIVDIFPYFEKNESKTAKSVTKEEAEKQRDTVSEEMIG